MSHLITAFLPSFKALIFIFQDIVKYVTFKYPRNIWLISVVNSIKMFFHEAMQTPSFFSVPLKFQCRFTAFLQISSSVKLISLMICVHAFICLAHLCRKGQKFFSILYLPTLFQLSIGMSAQYKCKFVSFPAHAFLVILLFEHLVQIFHRIFFPSYES